MTTPPKAPRRPATNEYWQGRMGGADDLAASGHRSLGASYNRWIYARRLTRLEALLASLPLAPPQLRVLDVGCGNGFYTEFWQAQGVENYLGLDISAAAVARLQERYPGYGFMQLDICQPAMLADQAGQFDLITLFDVLYHIVDDANYRTLLANLARLLSPRGRLVIFEQPAPRQISLRPHVVYRSKATLLAELEQAGLKLLHAEPLFAWLAPPVFGRPLLDTCIAGTYKLAGLFMKMLPPLGDLTGRAIFALDDMLLAKGSGPPNHELLVVGRKETLGEAAGETEESMLAAGIPTMAELAALKNSRLYRELQQYADRFLAAHPCLTRNRWATDPFHQWSRQWEYPFAWQGLRQQLGKKLNGRGRVLDAGSGSTFFPFFVQKQLPAGTVHCCDGDPAAAELFSQLQAGRPGPPLPSFTTANLESLPYGDGMFDAIACISVLEHTDQPAAIVAELARILKPGGLLLLTFDLGLDGVSELTPSRLAPLCAVLTTHFHNAPVAADLQQQLTSNEPLLSTAEIRRQAPHTLPWRFPRLSLLKAAVRAGRLPTKASKELSLCCCRLTRRG